MSEIRLADRQFDTIRVSATRIYDLYESIAASKYPMQVEPDPMNDELTKTAVKLAQSPCGEGHDNWLQGVRVAFNVTMTAKCLIEAERYHFWDIVSCNSTMHRIARFDLDKAYERCACNFTDDGGEPATEWYCVEDALENAPTIDAIPVEWIENMLKEWLKSSASFETCGAISAMLMMWQKEQEAR